MLEVDHFYYFPYFYNINVINLFFNNWDHIVILQYTYPAIDVQGRPTIPAHKINPK